MVDIEGKPYTQFTNVNVLDELRVRGEPVDPDGDFTQVTATNVPYKSSDGSFKNTGLTVDETTGELTSAYSINVPGASLNVGNYSLENAGQSFSFRDLSENFVFYPVTTEFTEAIGNAQPIFPQLDGPERIVATQPTQDTSLTFSTYNFTLVNPNVGTAALYRLNSESAAEVSGVNLIFRAGSFTAETPIFDYKRDIDPAGFTVPAGNTNFEIDLSPLEVFFNEGSVLYTTFTTDSTEEITFSGTLIDTVFIPFFEVEGHLYRSAEIPTTDTVKNLSGSDAFLITNSRGSSTNDEVTGLVAIYKVESTAATVTDQVWVPGDVGGGTGPTVITNESDVFSAGDIVQVTGTRMLNGLYEVASHTGTTLVFRGVGPIPTVQNFSETDFVTFINYVDSGTITLVNVSTIQTGTDGEIEHGVGNNADTFTVVPISNANGDVTGPASNTLNAIGQFSGTSGKIIQDTPNLKYVSDVLALHGDGTLPGSHQFEIVGDGQDAAIALAGNNQNFPAMYLDAIDQDDMTICYGAYYDGTNFRSSSANSNFIWTKLSSQLLLETYSGIAQGDVLTGASTAVSVSADGEFTFSQQSTFDNDVLITGGDAIIRQANASDDIHYTLQSNDGNTDYVDLWWDDSNARGHLDVVGNMTISSTVQLNIAGTSDSSISTQLTQSVIGGTNLFLGAGGNGSGTDYPVSLINSGDNGTRADIFPIDVNPEGTVTSPFGRQFAVVTGATDSNDDGFWYLDTDDVNDNTPWVQIASKTHTQNGVTSSTDPSTDTSIAVYDGTSGKLIKEVPVTVASDGSMLFTSPAVSSVSLTFQDAGAANPAQIAYSDNQKSLLLDVSFGDLVLNTGGTLDIDADDAMEFNLTGLNADFTFVSSGNNTNFSVTTSDGADFTASQADDNDVMFSLSSGGNNGATFGAFVGDRNPTNNVTPTARGQIYARAASGDGNSNIFVADGLTNDDWIAFKGGGVYVWGNNGVNSGTTTRYLDPSFNSNQGAGTDEAETKLYINEGGFFDNYRVTHGSPNGNGNLIEYTFAVNGVTNGSTTVTLASTGDTAGNTERVRVERGDYVSVHVTKVSSVNNSPNAIKYSASFFPDGT